MKDAPNFNHDCSIKKCLALEIGFDYHFKVILG